MRATASREKLENVVNAPIPPTARTVDNGGGTSCSTPSRNEPTTLTSNVPDGQLARFHLRPASARANAPAPAVATKASTVITAPAPTAVRPHAPGAAPP